MVVGIAFLSYVVFSSFTIAAPALYMTHVYQQSRTQTVFALTSFDRQARHVVHCIKDARCV